MKFTFVLGALLLAAIPAKADSFALTGSMDAHQLAPVTQSDGMIINCPCGPTVESFQTSFTFDTASQSVSDMTFNSNGPLGPFSFTGVTTNAVAANPATDFTWSSSMASIIFNVYDQYFGAGFLPSHSLTLDCLSTACIADFGGTAPTFLNDLGTATDPRTPTPTPEPSSLLLLGSGLASLSFLRKLIASSR